MSNILDVFNPKTPPNGQQPQEPCFPCLLTSAAVMIAGGGYMASGAVFMAKEGQPLPQAATPAWRATVRLGGVGVLALGLYRAYDTLMLSKEADSKLH
ncbi:hypothetical protein AWJ20_313 [Sugiyamaella lignohabitans]|uniref:DUF4536 domain-containing protein n=1 Tax=Sugiyamaella lignohabitans TaxID=796027 RepID=A0A161HKC2_9ASCO|nr:uncharacterized protein AWJ20_313 [Sugiyamaella lignohabitans]ANB12078.1 hypothetical protein AWJ20_313 [Sugiyamaella lignohabitans]